MERGEGTRERIIEKAAALFNQRGFSGAALSDIMEATGVRKGGIYWHFGSKEELALLAFDYAAGQLRERYERAMAPYPDVMGRLGAFIESFCGLYDDAPLPGGCALMNTAIESDDGNEYLRQRSSAALGSLCARLRQIMMEGRARGEVRSDVDSHQVATVLVATLEGALAMARLNRDRRYLDDAAAHLHWMLEARVRA